MLKNDFITKKRGGRSNLDLARRIFEHIEQNPGINYYDLARALGIKNIGSLIGYLATIENQGWLLSEDEFGRLWPFLNMD